MTRMLRMAAGFLFLTLVGCAPSIVRPQALVTPLSFQDAYRAAVHAVSVQPYPAGTSGWVITKASRTDGFVSAELTERRCRIDHYGAFARTVCYPYRSLVTVTLVTRADGTTEVDVGDNATPEARRLAGAIGEALRLEPAQETVHL